MTFLICHNFAHRMTASGVMESTPLMAEGDAIAVDEHGWMQRLPQTMDLSGGDITEIESMLVRLNGLFPGDYQRLPFSTLQNNEQLDPARVL